MKKLVLFLIFLCNLQGGFAQVKGAFTDVHVKRTLFPDIPSYVHTYIDSIYVFGASQKTILHQTFDANGNLSNGTSTAYWTYLFGGGDTSDIVISASWSGTTLTLLNTIHADGSFAYAREVVSYENGLAKSVNIDTASDKIHWGPKYRYEFTYNGSKVTSFDYLIGNGTSLYVTTRTKMAYDNGLKPVTCTSYRFDEASQPVDTTIGTYYYTRGKLDSIVGKNPSLKSASYKYVTSYSGSQIQKVDTYQSFFGELIYSGSSWFYDYDVTTGWEQTELNNQVRLVNPVRNELFVSSPQIISYDVLDKEGKKIISSFTNIAYDVSGLSSGIYFVRVYGTNATITRKMLKE